MRKSIFWLQEALRLEAFKLLHEMDFTSEVHPKGARRKLHVSDLLTSPVPVPAPPRLLGKSFNVIVFDSIGGSNG